MARRRAFEIVDEERARLRWEWEDEKLKADEARKAAFREECDGIFEHGRRKGVKDLEIFQVQISRLQNRLRICHDDVITGGV